MIDPAILHARPPARPSTRGWPAGRQALGLHETRDAWIAAPADVPDGAPLPLLVALHGAGGTADQMLDLLEEPCRRAGVVLLAPESREATWDVIRGGFGPDVAFLDRALEVALDLGPVDGRKIAIGGFSDGASYALSIGIPNGTLFSDILAFSPGFMAPPSQAGRPRIFVSHGSRDEVLPIERCSRQLAPRLRIAGYDVDYVGFEGGHVVPDEVLARATERFLQT